MAGFKYSLKSEQNKDLDLDVFYGSVLLHCSYGSKWTTACAVSDAYKSET